MKLLKFFIATGLIISVFACKKSQIAAVTPTNDDAAILLAGALANDNYGMSNLTTDISTAALNLTNNSTLTCGSSLADSITRQNTPGAAASYKYKVKYTNKFNCNTNSIPDNLAHTGIYTGNFEGPRLKVTSSGSTNYRIGGLTPTAAAHVFNGDYKSTTNFKFKSDTTNRGTVNILVLAKDLIISKTTHTIQSGKAMVIVTGSSTKKSTFTFNGNLTFDNATSATLSLNGAEYAINLVTGEAAKK